MKISISKPLSEEPHYTGARGLYSAVSLSRISKFELQEFCNDARLGELTEGDHCTIFLSKTNVKLPTHYETVGHCVAKVKKIIWWKGFDNKGCIIATLESDDLNDANELLQRLCNTKKEYKPHITLITPKKYLSQGLKTRDINYANWVLRQKPITLHFEAQRIEDYLG